MKKIFILTVSLVLFFGVYADNPCESSSGPYGPVTCTDGITPTISANGPVSIKGTVVEQGTHVNGPLSAEQATFNGLTVNGSVNLQTCSVKGVTVINGSLKAVQTTFQDTITISTNSAVFSKSTTGDIIIDNSGNGIVSPQTLTINQASKINGNITFKADDGVVNLGPNSVITGKVIGGTVIKEVAKPTPVTTTAATGATQP